MTSHLINWTESFVGKELQKTSLSKATPNIVVFVVVIIITFTRLESTKYSSCDMNWS